LEPEKERNMIDGISGGGGPIRGTINQRTAETPAADAGKSLRRAGPANDIFSVRGGRSGLVAELAKAPPVNAARVADLKAKIEGGRYPIDPLRIADAMIALDRGRP
jgi:flagellar biosynthesis anti-sigma factor FlgM